MPRLDIDVAFDFSRDTPEGKDPDIRSKTLCRYRRLLWSKPLPSGVHFGLSDSVRGHYLHEALAQPASSGLRRAACRIGAPA